MSLVREAIVNAEQALSVKSNPLSVIEEFTFFHDYSLTKDNLVIKELYANTVFACTLDSAEELLGFIHNGDYTSKLSPVSGDVAQATNTLLKTGSEFFPTVPMFVADSPVGYVLCSSKNDMVCIHCLLAELI